MLAHMRSAVHSRDLRVDGAYSEPCRAASCERRAGALGQLSLPAHTEPRPPNPGTESPCWLRPRAVLPSRRDSRRAGAVSSPSKEVIYVPPPQPPDGALHRRPRSANANAAAVAARRRPEANFENNDDVIDLGAPPRRLFRRASAGEPAQRRRRRGLTPNPRLYPGPQPKPKPQPRRSDAKCSRRRGKRKLRPVPNSRLYRPPPPRVSPPTPPPARPRARWPPPPPVSASLDTASNVVLRRLRYPPETPPPPKTPPRTCSPTPGQLNQRALVVKLPSARTPRYQPASEHFRARQSPSVRSRSPAPAAQPRLRPKNMDSATAEDRSEGNETLLAPSEYLAEFLSAIMRRQYAEALKYCRLILQYEPHNATAQSFYPLLRQKLRAASPARSPSPAPSPAHSASPPERSLPTLDSDEEPPPPAPPDLMERGSSSEDEDQSDLELDSSHDSSPSISISRHTTRTEYSTSGSAAGSGGGGWESSGSGGGERSASAPPDDNGNPTPARQAYRTRPRLTADDLENDNASAAGGEPHHSLKSDSVSSLRRLRAQFACSIK